MDKGGIQEILPPEETSRDTQPDYTGPEDIVLYEDEEGWTFEAGLACVKAHFGSFPFVSQFPGAFEDLYKDLEALMAHGRIAKGCFPARSSWQQDVETIDAAECLPRSPDLSKNFESSPENLSNSTRTSSNHGNIAK